MTITHTTEIEVCDFEEEREPINPVVFVNDYSIPAGVKEYETNLELTFPSSNGTNEFDEGDYHFHLNVTDAEGWSSQIGLNIKILHP